MSSMRPLLLLALLLSVGHHSYSQSRPMIRVDQLKVQAELMPEDHELEAVAEVVFTPLEATETVVFEISENLSVRRILDSEGVEIEFGQGDSGPGLLALRFGAPLDPGIAKTIKMEYEGGFDRDQFSRLYARDESSAYIGMEGTYLLFLAKWFPVSGFLADRVVVDFEITVPLGMTVVGPGNQLDVVTKGITESFSWGSGKPILSGSVVAGRYFEKEVQLGDVTITCLAEERHLDAIEQSAEVLAEILQFYTESFGPAAAGKSFRLVEVDDRVRMHPGTLGTVFVTNKELSATEPDSRWLARRAAYQWWGETVTPRSPDDLWLVDGMSYFSAALYLGSVGGEEAFADEVSQLAVLGLKSESKSAVRVGVGLGYRTEDYESVVAGKGAWIFNMLRPILGEDKFNQLQREYIARFAESGGSTADFRQLAEEIHGESLAWFVAEWVDTIGVPELDTEYIVFKTVDGFRISGSVSQDRDLFRMPIEIEVETKDGTKKTEIELRGKSAAFDMNTFSMPLKVTIDPDNKILRDSRELQTTVQISRGDDYKEKEQFIDAIRAYEEAIQLNARKSLAHFRLAEVFWEQFNLQAAANSFRDALNGDREPAWIEVWSYIYLGKVYDILGQRQRALAEYNKAANTKDETFGAQEEAKKWLAQPFTRERTTMQPARG